MIVIAICGILAARLSMCVSWTAAGSPTIEGVQGRYFLPFLPLIFTALRCTRFRWAKNGTAITLTTSMMWLNVIYAMWIMATGLTIHL